MKMISLESSSLIIHLASNSKFISEIQQYGLTERRFYFQKKYYLSIFYLNGKKIRRQIVSWSVYMLSVLYCITVDFTFIIASSDRELKVLKYKPSQIEIKVIDE